MAEFTTMEIAFRTRKSERQVQRWIKSGKLPARHIDGPLYEVNEDDLTPFLPREVVNDLVERIALLEARITQLEGIIEGLSSSKPQRSQRTPSRPPASSTLPDGLVPLTAFYHGVPETTVRRAMQSGDLPVIRGDWKKEGHIVTQALDADGRRQFLALFAQHPQFRPCDHCPHDLV